MKVKNLICPKQDYETPKAVCIDIDHEGVLCSSTEDLVNDESWIELLED